MVRNYEPRAVPEQSLDRIARAALSGPSAGNTKGIEVVLVTAEALRRETARLVGEESYVGKGFDPWVSRAPAHLVITVSEEAYRDRYREPDKLGPGGELDWAVPFWWVDAGAAMMAALLSAVDEGLAAGFLGIGHPAELCELLGIPQGHLPLGIMTLGYPAPDRRSASLDRPAPPKAQRIHRDGWES